MDLSYGPKYASDKNIESIFQILDDNSLRKFNASRENTLTDNSRKRYITVFKLHFKMPRLSETYQQLHSVGFFSNSRHNN